MKKIVLSVLAIGLLSGVCAAQSVAPLLSAMTELAQKVEEKNVLVLSVVVDPIRKGEVASHPMMLDKGFTYEFLALSNKDEDTITVQVADMKGKEITADSDAGTASASIETTTSGMVNINVSVPKMTAPADYYGFMVLQYVVVKETK
ncbi:MAG: hypothetical protein Q4D98_13335 [Planctomycetia bacterium]|nr:hypothetical protein [Planctomycetia bacterium]